MIDQTFKKLSDPFPYSRGFWTEMFAILRLCIVMAIIFYLVEPFGIQCASTAHLMVFGIIAFLSALVNWSVTHFIAVQYINTEQWTIVKDIIRSLIFLIITALTLLWYADFIGNNFNVSLAIKFITYTFLVAIIPLYYRNMSIHNILLKKRLEEAQKLNQLIDKKNVAADDNYPITIKSNIVNEAMETNSKELLYIKSEKNYINIVLLREEQIENALLRLSLVNTLPQLNDDLIIQCHRSYLVNLRHVSKVSGNSQGLKLILNGTIKIPVSKTYKKEVMNKLADLKGKNT